MGQMRRTQHNRRRHKGEDGENETGGYDKTKIMRQRGETQRSWRGDTEEEMERRQGD